MNQQEERLNSEKAKALDEAQQRHDGQVAELVTAHEREVAELKEQIAAVEQQLAAANALGEKHIAQIARLGEERDDLTTQRDNLDAELKASQFAAERLRGDLEDARRRIAGLEATLKDTEGVRDQLRAKLEGDLARVDKSKQAIAVALELLNEVEPL
jgi:chromosome segregation ATPase